MTLLRMVDFGFQRGLGAEEGKKQTLADCLCFPRHCSLLIFAEVGVIIPILQTGT